MKPRSILLLLSFVLLPVVLAQSASKDVGIIPTLTTDPPKDSSSSSSSSTTTTPTTTSPTTTTTPPTTTPPTTTPPPPSDTQPSQPPPLTNDPNTTSVPPTSELGPDTTTAVITPSRSTSAASTPSAPADDKSSSSGFGTGSIIGLSVAGGVALLGLIGFFVWKFTRKNRSAFDDNEAIKWPELNAHSGSDTNSHPLPVHNTGRSGFDTGSDTELSRVPSTTTGDYNPSMQDVYAVPALPHMNPNQPYRDDPNGGYYDPYRGPVPNQFHDSGEAIAMTQMGGRMSPGPGMAYDGGRSMTPGAGGRASPGPHAAYATDQYGRSSPAPHNPYGAGRASPGPQQVYGRSSPGPQAAYDPYGQRM